MSRIRVGRDQWGGWAMTCTDHDANCWTDDWASAYEAALGHACLHHPRPRVEVDATGWVRDYITATRIATAWRNPR